MKHQIYQVDAFTQETFGGNPACVVPLTSWLSDEQLLHIAKENAVAETAFFVPKDDHFHLRWFTQDIEIDLCGHATLAASHVIHTTLSQRGTPIRFETLSGTLTVAISGGVYYLDLPARPPVLSELPENIWEALSLKPKVVMKARDYILVYDDPSDIAAIQINRERFDQINLGYGGVCVTAQGSDCDFVSRFFTPQATILEDPVTGSSHCSLIPYWSEVLAKKKMTARQISERGGTLICEDQSDRVLIGGHAVTYLVGHFFL